MGTRGFLGFVIDGTEKIAYNHSDSYPEGLGNKVLAWVRANHHELACATHQAIVERARQLLVVDPRSTPTPADVEALAEFTDLGVGERGTRPTWYQLLRRTQGDLGAILRAGVIEDASEFPLDSLFAKHGYLVDLDTSAFVAYRGFRREPHDRGRFAGRAGGGNPGYYPVAEVARWTIEAMVPLPTYAEFLSALGATQEG